MVVAGRLLLLYLQVAAADPKAKKVAATQVQPRLPLAQAVAVQVELKAAVVRLRQVLSFQEQSPVAARQVAQDQEPRVLVAKKVTMATLLLEPSQDAPR